EATVRLPAATTAVRVTDAATGAQVPAQVTETDGSGTHIVFLASAPSVGFRVYHVAAGASSPEAATSLKVTAAALENNRIAVRIDGNGDIASIYDKDAKRELLKAPIMLEIRDDPSPAWPAWEVLYDTVQAPARDYVSHPTIKIIERGPARVGIEVTRHAEGSTFVQRVRLTEGGDRVDVENLVDWRSPNALLKASFPLSAASPKATYDLGVGTIERTNNEPDKYEVPAQKWADVTDVSRSFGVGIINDSKYGWDKPTDDVLRLTLIHTPQPRGGYTYQSSNDLGRHRFVYAIAGHAGDWRQGRLPVRAAELNQPLIAFQTDSHPGALGRAVSLLSLDDTTGQVAAVALKKAEDSDEVIVRLQERYGMPARTTLRFAGNIVAAREVTATEEPVGPIQLTAGRGGGRRGQALQPPPTSFPTVSLDLKPYQPRAIAVTLQPPASPATGALVSAPVALPFNLDGVSGDADRADGDFDGAKHTLAGELLPRELVLDGVRFAFGSSDPGAMNVLVPKGQRLTLPAGDFNRVYLIAAAVGSGVIASIGVGAAAQSMTVPEWEGPVGQWWSRLKAPSALREPFVPASAANAQTTGRGGNPSQAEIQGGLVVQWDPSTGGVKGIDQIRPAFVTRDEIAWIGTHRHSPGGNQIYVPSFLFVHAIDLPRGTHEIRLPANDKLRILAITAVQESGHATPASILYARDIPSPLSSKNK
ncbi:MAG TPA: glycoside hydrolase family 38 C-terminal domain-containing protein, partial [Vicinamibacterales bacterium]|nr:glycoside hydrolase family 38 C-terminal domain-containing protein [Vicinamibacterales bacterium]